MEYKKQDAFLPLLCIVAFVLSANKAMRFIYAPLACAVIHAYVGMCVNAVKHKGTIIVVVVELNE